MIKVQHFRGFIFKDHLLSTLQLHMHCENFEDLIFVDDKLSVKTAKITSLENLYVYGNSCSKTSEEFRLL